MVKSTLEKDFGLSFGLSGYFCGQKGKRWLRLKPGNLPDCPGEHSNPILIGCLKVTVFAGVRHARCYYTGSSAFFSNLVFIFEHSVLTFVRPPPFWCVVFSFKIECSFVSDVFDWPSAFPLSVARS